MIDSRLENIDHTRITIPLTAPFEQLLDDFMNPPDEIVMDDLESDDESVDTPLVSPFLDSDDESDDGEVLNELDEYGNAGIFYHNRIINSLDGEDLSFPCMIGFRKFVAYFDPFFPMNIITRKAYNTIIVEGLESTGRNLVAIVRDVYVFVESFTYVMDFVVLEDIGEFLIFDTYIFWMPRTIPRLKNFEWSKVSPILVLSQRDLMSGLRSDLPLRRSSINKSARLSHKFGRSYFSFKFVISGCLHQWSSVYDAKELKKRVPTSWEGVITQLDTAHKKFRAEFISKLKKMKPFQDMQLIQKLRDDQKRMKKTFEDVSGTFGKHLEKIHVTWTQFGKKRDKIATLHEEAQKVHTVRGDGVVISSDGVRKFVTTSGLTDSKEAL
ncbi:hypothetical protein Tco_0431870 [Tanacetum coccineum]